METADQPTGSAPNNSDRRNFIAASIGIAAAAVTAGSASAATVFQSTP
ncbi:MAG: hypothetical protein RL254_1792, partial [Planctomycetota bacterium]